MSTPLPPAPSPPTAVRRSPGRLRSLGWVGFGFVGTLVFTAAGVGLSTLFTYADEETEAWAGPMLGFLGYLTAIVVLPVICVVIERKRADTRIASAVMTLLGSLLPGGLVFVVLFVLVAILNP